LGHIQKVIFKAISACALLNINVLDMFIETEREIGGRKVADQSCPDRRAA
jgi:hypothetical protein